jgi:hypothetical protein
MKEEPQHAQRLPLINLKLLDWIINAERDGFTLRSLPVIDYMSQMSGRTSSRRQQAHTTPTYVFELVYQNERESIRQFEEAKSIHGSLMGHHGSSLENFHSIVRFGLDESFGRSSSIFGEGIYFSQDREVAHSFLKQGAHQVSGTQLGSQFGMMTATEVINHPTDVRHASSPPHPSGISLDDSSKPLPPGYLISTSSKLTLTRFLLVFPDSPTPSTSRLVSKEALSWGMIIVYIIVVLIIWWSKSKAGDWQKLGIFGLIRR